QVLAFQGAKSIDDSARLRTKHVPMSDLEAPWERELHEEDVTTAFWALADQAHEEGLSAPALRDRFYSFTLFANEMRRKLHASFQTMPIFDDTAEMLQNVLVEGGDPERILQVTALDPFLTLDVLHLGNALLIDPEDLVPTARKAAEVAGTPALVKFARLL